MKALVYAGPEKIEFQDIAVPELREQQVLLKIAATGICGSDVHGFLGHSERRKPGLILGHEAVATVAEAHGTVSQWKSGQRVVVNPLISCLNCPACLNGKQNLCARWSLLGLDRVQGTFAEFTAVPATQIFAIPDGLSDTAAVFVEPLANVVHFFRTAMSEIPESLAIFGAGPIGSLALALAKLRGIPNVCVIDQNEQRLDIARQIGADCVINSAVEDAITAVKEFTRGGAEFVIDAVGINATRRAGVQACARGGRLVFIGMAENDSGLPWIDMIRNELSVFTTFCYSARDFQTSLSLLESHKLDFTRWTENRSLNEGQASFMKMAHNPGGTLKLIFKP